MRRSKPAKITRQNFALFVRTAALTGSARVGAFTWMNNENRSGLRN